MKQLKFMVALGLLGIFSAATLHHEALPDSVNTSEVKKDEDTFFLNLDPSGCRVDIEKRLGKSSLYQEEINGAKGIRKITINGIANHKVGSFPNSGNPNRIREFKATYSIPLNPKVAKKATGAQGYDTGVFFSGAGLEPFTTEF